MLTFLTYKKVQNFYILKGNYFAFRTFCMANKAASCAEKRGVSHFVQELLLPSMPYLR